MWERLTSHCCGCMRQVEQASGGASTSLRRRAHSVDNLDSVGKRPRTLGGYGPAEGLGRIFCVRVKAPVRVRPTRCHGAFACPPTPSPTPPPRRERPVRWRRNLTPPVRGAPDEALAGDRRSRAAGDRSDRADRRQRPRAVRRFGPRPAPGGSAPARRRTRLARGAVTAAVDELARRGRHHVHRRDGGHGRTRAPRPHPARVGSTSTGAPSRTGSSRARICAGCTSRRWPRCRRPCPSTTTPAAPCG